MRTPRNENLVLQAADGHRRTAGSIVIRGGQAGRRSRMRGEMYGCGHCHEPHYVRPSMVAQGRGLFCSRHCRSAYSARPEVVARRFWEKVDKNGPVPELRPDLGPCWIWTGGVNSRGYGMASIGWDKTDLTHIYTWEAVNGPVPDGRVLDHLCTTRRCCNPSHLEPVTNAINIWRGGNARPRRDA